MRNIKHHGHETYMADPFKHPSNDRLTPSLDTNRSQTQSRAKRVGWLILAVATISFVWGCHEGSNPNGKTREPQADHPPGLFAFDPLPADMGLWECAQYLTAIQGTSHETTLRELLKMRPHTYWEPARRSSLVEVPDELIAQDRLNHPVYLHLMELEALESLRSMVHAAAAVDIALRVQSAYRSPSYQNALWKVSLRHFQFDLFGAAFDTAPPCFSEHATGRAVDFEKSNGGDDTFEKSAAYQWLHDNASKWGWVQSFREDNGAVRSSVRPGIMVEPWHFHHSSIEQDEQSNAP